MIPHFFLDFGNFQIFQPQNTKDLEISSTFYEDPDFRVRKSGRPEIDGYTLFINGKSSDKMYNFLSTNRPSYSQIMKKSVDKLKELEE